MKHTSAFKEYELADMKEYLNEFFEILKNDKLFDLKILQTCRTNK